MRENISNSTSCAPFILFSFLPHFDVIYDLLQKIRITTLSFCFTYSKRLRFISFLLVLFLFIHTFTIIIFLVSCSIVLLFPVLLENWSMLSVRISSCGCRWEVWRAREKRRVTRDAAENTFKVLSVLQTSQVHSWPFLIYAWLKARTNYFKT